MTVGWIVALLIVAAVALLAVWASARQRRHSGTGTLDDARNDAIRRDIGPGPHGSS